MVQQQFKDADAMQSQSEPGMPNIPSAGPRKADAGSDSTETRAERVLQGQDTARQEQEGAITEDLDRQKGAAGNDLEVAPEPSCEAHTIARDSSAVNEATADTASAKNDR